MREISNRYFMLIIASHNIYWWWFLNMSRNIIKEDFPTKQQFFIWRYRKHLYSHAFLGSKKKRLELVSKTENFNLFVFIVKKEESIVILRIQTLVLLFCWIQFQRDYSSCLSECKMPLANVFIRRSLVRNPCLSFIKMFELHFRKFWFSRSL